jgi:hypothetical protein
VEAEAYIEKVAVVLVEEELAVALVEEGGRHGVDLATAKEGGSHGGGFLGKAESRLMGEWRWGRLTLCRLAPPGKNQSVPVHLRYYTERKVDKCR